jgi:hypothetical protein
MSYSEQLLAETSLVLRWWIAPGLIGALACASGDPAGPQGGSLQVEWVGADTGKLSAPAVAEWCDSLRLLELRAIGGDTGIALLLYPSDSGTPSGTVAPGDYPVVPPQRADSTRPAAAVALRWFAETSIRGFRGDSGTVVLESIGPDAARAGRFSARLRSATEGSRLTVTGSFKGLTVTPAPPACAGEAESEPEEPEEPAEPDEPTGEDEG